MIPLRPENQQRNEEGKQTDQPVDARKLMCAAVTQPARGRDRQCAGDQHAFRPLPERIPPEACPAQQRCGEKDDEAEQSRRQRQPQPEAVGQDYRESAPRKESVG